MKPDIRVLDANLRGLLVRAYVPALPRPEFRARLAGELAAALARRPRAGGPRPRLLRPVLALAAAGLLVGAGLVLRALLTRAPHAATAEEILARAEVAVHDGSGWRAATADELARGLTLGARPTEVALASGAELELHAAEGRLRASGGARLALEPANSRASLSGSLATGELFLEREAPAGSVQAAPWTVRAGASELLFEHGALALARSGERASFWLERGVASVAGAAERFELVPGVELVLVGGLPVPTALAASRAEPETGPERRALEPDRPAAGEPAVSPAPSAPAALHGSVSGPDGAPIERFRVALLPQRIGNDLRSSVVRDFERPDGAFDWPDVPPGRYRPFVWAEGFALLTLPELEIAPGVELPRLNARLERGGTLVGRVIDGASGAGIADALVVAERDTPEHALLFGDADREQWLPASTRTRTDGSFELVHLSSGEHTLRASAAGFGPAWSEATLVNGEATLVNGEAIRVDGDASAASGARAVEIALAPGGTLEGRVLGVDGLPLSGERVLVTPMDESRHPQMNLRPTTTDVEGRFRVEDLPLGYVIVVHVPGREAPPVVKPAEIVLGESAWVEFSTEPTGTRLTGTLFDADGRPLGNENLALYAEGSMDDFLATGTLPDGAYVFDDLVPGRYRLFRVGHLGRWVRLIGEVEVPPLAVFEHDFRLGPGTIAGFLRERDTGEPVRAAVLLVDRLDGSEPAAAGSAAAFAGNAESEPSGEFRIDGLPAGRYVLRAHPTLGGLGQEHSAELVLTAEAPEAVVELEFAPGGSIEVHATEPDGTPIPRADIEFVDADGFTSSFAQYPLTDERGIFLAEGVRVGRYGVRASADGFASGTISVECRAGERARAEVVLQPLTAPDEGDGR